MSQKRTVILECDFCGAKGDHVRTRLLALDKDAVEVEICEKDYNEIRTRLVLGFDKGRRIVLVPQAPRKRRTPE